MNPTDETVKFWISCCKWLLTKELKIRFDKVFILKIKTCQDTSIGTVDIKTRAEYS